MEKPAPVDHPVHPLIQNRWSPCAFSDRRLDDQTILSLMEAARWAPSSFNDQPWSFLVATREQEAEFAKIVSCLTPVNQAWAPAAGLLAVAVAHLVRERNGDPNHQAFHDIGLTVAFLTFQAASMGLVVHEMGGISRERVSQVFEIPPRFQPVTALAVGYPGDGGRLTGEAGERDSRERTRKPLSSFVFHASWGQSAPVVSG